MLPYHTRFGPDWCFGLIKMKYKHSYVSSISQLAEVVLISTTKPINIPQLISEPCSDKTLVPVHAWKVFLEPASERYQTLPSIIIFVFLRQSQAKYSSEKSPPLLNSVSV